MSKSRSGYSVGGPPGLDVTVVQIVVPTSRGTVRKWLYEEVEALLQEYRDQFEAPDR